MLSKYASKRLLEECIVGAEVACAEQLCKLTCLGSIEGDGRLRPPLAREKTTVEDEGERLLALLATCEEVLRGIEGDDDEATKVIHDTCRAIEARLQELGVRFSSALA